MENAQSGVLLLRVFPAGFTVLNEPRGGAKKDSAEAYCDLADKFDAYLQKNVHHSDTANAKNFIGKELKVGQETITTRQGLLKAVKRGRAERQRRIEQHYNEQILTRYGAQLALAGVDRSPLFPVKKPAP